MTKKRSVTMKRDEYRDWKSDEFWLCAEQMSRLFRIPAKVKKIRFTISAETFEGAREYTLHSPTHSSLFYRMSTKRSRANIPSSFSYNVMNWIEPIISCKGASFSRYKTKPIFIKLEILETL